MLLIDFYILSESPYLWRLDDGCLGLYCYGYIRFRGEEWFSFKPPEFRSSFLQFASNHQTYGDPDRHFQFTSKHSENIWNFQASQNNAPPTTKKNLLRKRRFFFKSLSLDFSLGIENILLYFLFLVIMYFLTITYCLENIIPCPFCFLKPYPVSPEALSSFPEAQSCFPWSPILFSWSPLLFPMKPYPVSPEALSCFPWSPILFSWSPILFPMKPYPVSPEAISCFPWSPILFSWSPILFPLNPYPFFLKPFPVSHEDLSCFP